jgi:hypothetical protein
VVVAAYQPSSAPAAFLGSELARLPSPTRAELNARLVVVCDADLAGVDLAIPPAGLSMTGVILGPGGVPVSGARVKARPPDATGWQSKLAAEPSPYRTFSGPRGAFRIEDLPDGPFLLTVELPGLSPVELPAVTAGGGAVTVRLDPPP